MKNLKKGGETNVLLTVIVRETTLRKNHHMLRKRNDTHWGLRPLPRIYFLRLTSKPRSSMEEGV